MQGQFVYPTNAPNKISKNAPNQIKQINRRAKSLGVNRIIFWTMLTYGRPYVRPGVTAPFTLHNFLFWQFFHFEKDCSFDMEYLPYFFIHQTITYHYELDRTRHTYKIRSCRPAGSLAQSIRGFV